MSESQRNASVKTKSVWRHCLEWAGIVAYLGGFILFMEPSDQWTAVILLSIVVPFLGLLSHFWRPRPEVGRGNHSSARFS